MVPVFWFCVDSLSYQSHTRLIAQHVIILIKIFISSKMPFTGVVGSIFLKQELEMAEIEFCLPQ